MPNPGGSSRVRIRSTVYFPVTVIGAERQEQNTIKWTFRADNGEEFTEVTDARPNGERHPWVDYIREFRGEGYEGAEDPEDTVGGKMRVARAPVSPPVPDGPQVQLTITKALPIRGRL